MRNPGTCGRAEGSQAAGSEATAVPSSGHAVRCQCTRRPHVVQRAISRATRETPCEGDFYMCWSPERQGLRSATLSAKCPTHARRWRTQVSHTYRGRLALAANQRPFAALKVRVQKTTWRVVGWTRTVDRMKRDDAVPACG